MAGENRILDDLSKLMTNAMGVAHGAKTEAETAFKGWVDRWLADRDFVTREEFEAVRELAVKARTEAAELRARLDMLEGRPASTPRNADAGQAGHAPAGATQSAGHQAGAAAAHAGPDGTRDHTADVPADHAAQLAVEGALPPYGPEGEVSGA